MYLMVLFALVIVFTVLFAGTYIYKHFYFYKDNLIKYFPRTTAAYAHLTLNEQVKKDFLENQGLLSQLEQFRLAEIFKNINREVSLGFIPVNEQLAAVVVFDVDNFNDFFKNFKSDFWQARMITPALAAISDSADALNLLTYQNKLPNLKQARDFKVKRFYFGSIAQAYINGRQAGRLSQHLNDQPPAQMFLTALTQNQRQDLYISLNKSSQRILIEISGLDQDFINSLNRRPLLVNYLPPGSVATLASANLQKSFNSWQRQLAFINPELKNYLDQLTDDFERTKNFQFQTERLLSAVNGPAELILLDKNNFVLILTNQFPRFSDIEETVRSVMAVNFPVSQPKLLPDGTEVIELVADPTTILTEQSKLNRPEALDIYKINPPESEFQLIFGYSPKLVFITNKIDNIIQILEKNQPACVQSPPRLLEELMVLGQPILKTLPYAQGLQCVIIEQNNYQTNLELIY